jgi:hypothetical protein
MYAKVGQAALLCISSSVGTFPLFDFPMFFNICSFTGTQARNFPPVLCRCRDQHTHEAARSFACGRESGMPQVSTPETMTSPIGLSTVSTSKVFASQPAARHGAPSSIDERIANPNASLSICARELVITPLRDSTKAFDPTEAIVDAIARELTRRCGGNLVLNRMEAAAHFAHILGDTDRNPIAPSEAHRLD